MRKLLAALAAIVLGFGVMVPAALAAAPLPHTGRVLISTQGDVDIPAGEHADVVVVVDGTADIRGEVNTLVVVEGTAKLTGATLDTVVAVRSQVEVASGTNVYGELQRLDSNIHQTGNVAIHGGIVDLSVRFLDAGRALAPIFFLLWLGFALSTVVAGLLLAALAGRQVRAAERVISTEPVVTGLAGLLGAVLVPLVAILLFPTVVGAPLGFAILVVALPIVAFGGYLVAAAWVGERVMGVLGSSRERERPYAAIVLGVLVLGAVGLVPVLGLVTAVASLFGFGALIVTALRTIAGGSGPAADATRPMPMAAGA